MKIYNILNKFEMHIRNSIHNFLITITILVTGSSYPALSSNLAGNPSIGQPQGFLPQSPNRAPLLTNRGGNPNSPLNFDPLAANLERKYTNQAGAVSDTAPRYEKFLEGPSPSSVRPYTPPLSPLKPYVPYVPPYSKASPSKPPLETRFDSAPPLAPALQNKEKIPPLSPLDTKPLPPSAPQTTTLAQPASQTPLPAPAPQPIVIQTPPPPPPQILSCPIGSKGSMPGELKCIEPRIRRLEEGVNFALNATEKMISDSMQMPDQRPMIVRVREQIYNLYSIFDELKKNLSQNNEKLENELNQTTHSLKEELKKTNEGFDSKGNALTQDLVQNTINLKNEMNKYYNSIRQELESKLARLRDEIHNQPLSPSQNQARPNNAQSIDLLNEKIDSIYERLSQFNAYVGNFNGSMGDSLEDIAKRVSQLEKGLARYDQLAILTENMGDSLNTFDRRLGRLENGVIQMEDNFNDKLTLVNNLTRSQDALSSRLSDLENSLEGINDVMGRVLRPNQTGGALQLLSEELDRLQQEIRTNKTAVNNAQQLNKANDEQTQKAALSKLENDLTQLKYRIEDMERKFFDEVKKAAYDLIQAEMSKHDLTHRDEINKLREEMLRLKGQKPGLAATIPSSPYDDKPSLPTANLQKIIDQLSNLEGRMNSLESKSAHNPYASAPKLPLPPLKDPSNEHAPFPSNMQALSEVLARVERLEKAPKIPHPSPPSPSYDDGKVWSEIDAIWAEIDKLKIPQPGLRPSISHAAPSSSTIREYNDEPLKGEINRLWQTLKDVQAKNAVTPSESSKIQELMHKIAAVENTVKTLASHSSQPYNYTNDIEDIHQRIDHVQEQVEDLRTLPQGNIVANTGEKVDIISLKQDIEERLEERFIDLINKKTSAQPVSPPYDDRALREEIEALRGEMNDLGASLPQNSKPIAPFPSLSPAKTYDDGPLQKQIDNLWEAFDSLSAGNPTGHPDASKTSEIMHKISDLEAKVNALSSPSPQTSSLSAEEIDDIIYEALDKFRNQIMNLLGDKNTASPSAAHSPASPQHDDIKKIVNNFELQLQELKEKLMQEETDQDKLLNDVKDFINTKFNTWLEENLKTIASTLHNIKTGMSIEKGRNDEQDKRIAALETLVKQLGQPAPNVAQPFSLFVAPNAPVPPPALNTNTPIIPPPPPLPQPKPTPPIVQKKPAVIVQPAPSPQQPASSPFELPTATGTNVSQSPLATNVPPPPPPQPRPAPTPPPAPPIVQKKPESIVQPAPSPQQPASSPFELPTATGTNVSQSPLATNVPPPPPPPQPRPAPPPAPPIVQKKPESIVQPAPSPQQPASSPFIAPNAKGPLSALETIRTAQPPAADNQLKAQIIAVCQKEAETETANRYCPLLYNVPGQPGVTPVFCGLRSLLSNKEDSILASQTQAMYVACQEERLKEPASLPQPSERYKWKQVVSPSYSNKIALNKQRQDDITQTAKLRQTSLR